MGVLAFVISVVLNRAKVDHFWCLAVSVVVPLGLVFVTMQSHMGSGRAASEFWIEGLLMTVIPATAGFFFRKKRSSED